MVNGTKTFITSGVRADFVTTAVRTGGPGHAGISLLVIEKGTPGFTVDRTLTKMGWHCSDTAELAFVDARVPVANLVGEEGTGFAQIAEQFVVERIALAVHAYGIAARSLDLTAAYCRTRETFGTPLIANQVVRHRLVEMRRQVEVARAYTHAVGRAARRRRVRRRRGLPGQADRGRLRDVRLRPGRPAARRDGVPARDRGRAALPRRPDPADRRRGDRGADRPGRATAGIHRMTAATNREAMLEKLADLDAEHAKAVAGGGAKYADRHHARGKLLPRERIELLVDEGSAFLELSPLAGWGSDFTVGASVVTGIGVVEGVECLITANDPTVKGGASNPWTVRKIFRASQIAEENGLPTIALVESGGADLPTQKEIFIPGGRLFRDITRSSAAKQPTIALVFGNSTAGGAYVPGMSDYTVMVRGRAKVFLGGPPLVKMATGEESDDESLGGAEMHAQGLRARGLPGRGRARRDPDRPADRGPAQLAEGEQPRTLATPSRTPTPTSCST